MCGRCNKKLEQGKVQIRYLGKVFAIDVFKCPSCGMVMVTEEIAMGKIAEAEQLLEDK
jgi:CYTH domain-containing protein